MSELMLHTMLRSGLFPSHFRVPVKQKPLTGQRQSWYFYICGVSHVENDCNRVARTEGGIQAHFFCVRLT